MKKPAHESFVEHLEHRRLLDASAEFVFDFQTEEGGGDSIVVGNVVYFPADDGSGDVELWKADGSVDGTIRVKDIRVGRKSSVPQQLFAAKESIFFTAYDDQHGRELWVSNGSEQGTARLTDTEFDLQIQNVTEVGDLIYFTALGADFDSTQIWQSDGTPAGTSVVMTTGFRAATTSPIDSLTYSNGLLFVGVNHSHSGVWTIDLDNQTSERIYSTGTASVGLFYEIGDEIFFEFRNRQRQSLRRIDLETMRTEQLLAAYSGQIVEFEGELVYALLPNQSGPLQVFRSDGTEEGFTEILAVSSGVRNIQLHTAGNKLYLDVLQNNAKQLWVSDGTADGTEQYFASFNIDFGEVKSIGNNLYVKAFNLREDDCEIWRLSGEDLITHSEVSVDCRTEFVAAVDDRLLFREGQRLLITDGTQEGTMPFAASLPILSSYGSIAFDAGDAIQSLGSGLAILTKDGSIYLSDGSPSGTAQVETSAPIYSGIRSAGDVVYFLQDGPDGLFNVWAVDPANGDLHNIQPPNVEELYAETLPTSERTSSSVIYFQALSDLGDHIWVSDGTSEGTRTVLELDSLISGAGSNLFQWNNSIIFHTDDGSVNFYDGSSVQTLRADVPVSFEFYTGETRFYFSSGQELIASDGTEEGTATIGQARSDGAEVLGDRLYFAGNDGSLWVSDGTRDSTSLVVADAEFYARAVVGKIGDEVFFAVPDDGLWKSDGTMQGTVKVADIGASTWSGAKGLEDHGYLYFSGGLPGDEATALTDGAELWRTDGTTEGTVRVADIAPGSAASSPKYFTEVNGFLYFSADDGFRANELWRIPLSPIAGDADGNGKVNFADFLQLSANFGREDEVRYFEGDFNLDGLIDFEDFLLLSAHFGDKYEGNGA